MRKEEEIIELDDNGKSFLPVGKDMRLLLSARNWQLQKKRVVKDVEEWSSFRYYVSMDSALKDLMQIGLSKENFNSMDSFLQAQNKVIKNITKMFSPEYKLTKVEK